MCLSQTPRRMSTEDDEALKGIAKVNIDSAKPLSADARFTEHSNEHYLIQTARKRAESLEIGKGGWPGMAELATTQPTVHVNLNMTTPCVTYKSPLSLYRL